MRFMHRTKRFDLEMLPTSAGADSATLVIEVDGREQWTREVSGWQPVAVGTDGEITWAWTAREYFKLPGLGDEAITVHVSGEDLLAVFWLNQAWLLVRETSVYTCADDNVIRSVEFADVITRYHFEGTKLVVEDGSGKVHELDVRDSSWLDQSTPF